MFWIVYVAIAVCLGLACTFSIHDEFGSERAALPHAIIAGTLMGLLWPLLVVILALMALYLLVLTALDYAANVPTFAPDKRRTRK